MVLCALALALAAPACAAIGLSLTDGGIRRAFQFALAKRFGAPFTPEVIVVGDSLAAACPWRKLFRSPFATLNLAEGGATIKEIAGQVYRARAIPAPWLLINGGLNDLLFDAATPEQIEADYRALFRRVDTGRKVAVTLMPYIADPEQSGRIAAANVILSQLCAERGYAVIDLNPEIAREGVRKPDMTPDGLHFSSKAEAVWLEVARGLLRAQAV